MKTRSQNFLTPQVATQQADLSQAQTAASLADFAFNTAQVLQQKSNHKHELDFKNQTQEQVNDIYKRNISNPGQFKKEIDVAQRALVKGAPSHLRDDFKVGFARQTQPFLNKVTSNHDRVLTDQIKFSTLQRVQHAEQSATIMSGQLFSGTPDEVASSSVALKDLITDSIGAVSATDANGIPVLSAKERFATIKNFVDNVAFSSARSGFDESREKEAFLKSFESGELKAAFFLDEEGEFVQRSVRDGMDRATFEKTRNYMQSNINAINKQKAKEVVTKNQLEMMASVRSDEFILDPSNKEHQKAVDVDYAVYEQQISSLPQNQQLQANVDYVSKTGVFPTKLESQTRAALRNGTPGQVIKSADLIEKIAIEKPSSLRQFSNADRTLSRKISDNINAGVEPEMAVEFARNSFFNKGTEEYRVRQEEFKDKSIEFSEGFFTSFFADDPDIMPAAMQADYNQLNRSFFADGGLDAKAASDLAKEKVSQNWGHTDIGGVKRWSKYSPEKIYDNGMDMSWIGEQLISEIKVFSPKISADSVLLEISPATITQKAPSYLVFTQEENGLINSLIEPTGKQAVFTPDYQSSPLFKKLLDKHNGDMKSAMLSAKSLRSAAIAESRMQSVREGF